MESKTYSNVEDVLKDNPYWRFKGWGESIHMMRQSNYILTYTHWSGPNKGQPYTSVQDLIWARYSLTPLPGCHGVLVSHDSHLTEDKRGYGLGDFFHKERLSIAETALRSCMLCTVESNNEVEKHILQKNNWAKVHEFLNKDTNNTVEIWVKNL